jgi:hypothetical protein
MRKRRWALVAVAALSCIMAGVNAVPAMAGETDINPDDVRLVKVASSSGWTTLQNNNSHLVLAVESSRDDDGAPISQWSLTKQSNGDVVPEQLWMIDYVGSDMYAIRNAGTPDWKALSITNGSHARGARAIQWRYHGGLDQLWYIDRTTIGGFGQLRNVESGQCLGINSASTLRGARAIQWPCAGRNEMYWWGSGL